MKKEIKKEDKYTRFKRIAVKRTDAILHYLYLLGNCSNKSVYNYSDDDIRKVFGVIEDQLRLTKIKFKNSKGKRDFKL